MAAGGSDSGVTPPPSLHAVPSDPTLVSTGSAMSLPERLAVALGDAARQPLPELITRIARVAAAEVTSRYAAVTVLGREGTLEHFAAHGTSADAEARIGRLPSNGGLMGVVHGGTSVRLRDRTLDDRSGTLPAHHPPVDTILGVPLTLRGQPAGGVFVSEPRGRSEYDERDQQVAEAIAQAAAGAIEAARTAAENRRREEWHVGASALAKEIVLASPSAPWTLIADRVAALAAADLVLVVARGTSVDEFRVLAAAGDRAAHWRRVVLPTTDSLVATVMASGRPAVTSDMTQVLPPHMLAGLGLHSMALIPLSGTTGNRTVLGIGRLAGKRPFSDAETGMATMLAGQTALALELAETQSHRDRVALIEERDRIARDLHDHVIQRLFATGLAMQSAGLSLDGPAADVVRRSIDHIDETIKQIRTTIYQLTVPLLPSDSTLRARTTALFDDLERPLGFRPQFTVDGPVDFGVNEEVVGEALAFLREALTNVAKHARAERAAVSVVVTETELSLSVQDDGVGMGDTVRRSGLANMRTRAERRGGSLTVRSGENTGTRLIWTVPLTEG